MPAPDGPPDDPPEEAVADPYDPPVLSAREAAGRGMPGWPKPGEDFPPPTHPVPAGRGGEQIIPRPLNARAGRPAPWADLQPERRRPTLADVRASMAAAGPPMRSERETMPGIDRASAVLAPLYEHDGDLYVILTRRTWEMRAHSGEVSFPGGRQDDGEDLWTTALREAQRRSPSTRRASSRSESSTTSPPSRAGRSSSRSWRRCPADPRRWRTRARCPRSSTSASPSSSTPPSSARSDGPSPGPRTAPSSSSSWWATPCGAPPAPCSASCSGWPPARSASDGVTLDHI